MNTFAKISAMALSLALVASFASAASAETTFQQNHPRRAEVNARLHHLNHRIAIERREGELSRHQARILHARAHGIRAEERFDAARHGGHITRGEQRTLNHQENAVSGQIGR